MTQASSQQIVVALSDDIPEHGRTVVAIDGQEIGIFRMDGELYAYENYCQHAGGPVCQGILIGRVVELLDDANRSLGQRFSEEDLHIVCPWHGYEYNVKTGEHPTDPKIRLKSYVVTESNGEVSVEL